MRTDSLRVETKNGDSTAYIAGPDEDADKAVLVIQEWWGVNDHIKDIAGRYADEGYIAVAPDLYRGKIAENSDEASKMMHDLAIEDGIETITNTIAKVKESYGISRLGITGYCMGGTFALHTACEAQGLGAAVAFYGDIPDEDVLSKLGTPTLFISGTRDGWITPEKVAGLEKAAGKFGLPLQSVKYDADHAFFNNTRLEVYDEAAAKDAWTKALAFFKENL
jgi:carboxymethylenebutenolidase